MFEVNGILYAGSAKELLKIQDAKVTGEKMLLLTFSSGEKRVFDATVLNEEVFTPLNDPDIFSNFKIVHGVVKRGDPVELRTVTDCCRSEWSGSKRTFSDRSRRSAQG